MYVCMYVCMYLSLLAFSKHTIDEHPNSDNSDSHSGDPVLVLTSVAEELTTHCITVEYRKEENKEET